MRNKDIVVIVVVILIFEIVFLDINIEWLELIVILFF